MRGQKPTDPPHASGGPRRGAAPTLAFSDLDGDEPTVTTDSGDHPVGTSWGASDALPPHGAVPDIAPPMYLEEEAEVSAPSWGAELDEPAPSPWTSQSRRAIPQPTIIPSPDGYVDPDDMPTPRPFTAIRPGADARTEPEVPPWPVSDANDDRRRDPPPDLATLMARAGVGAPAPRPTPRLPFPAPQTTAEREVSQSRRRVVVETTLDTDEGSRSGGLRWRWVMVVLAAAVVAAVLGGAAAVLLRGAAVTLPGPVADVPGVDEVAEPVVTDDNDPLAGRMPPDGRSFVRFTSEPPGGVVRVDNEFVGRTPTTVELAYGSHKVLVTMEGHAGFSTSLEVDAPRETVDAPLGDGPTIGLVTVTALGMDGADVWVDGRHVGTVPATVNLAPGKHAFRVVGHAGTIETERSVRVPPSGVLQVDLTPQ